MHTKTLLLISLTASIVQAAELESELFDLDALVITPTMMAQSLADTPAPVTVITRQQLQAYGVRSIPEALRLVPGMAVGFTSGNEYRINYHGTNGSLPRRMQVLIDGISIYRNSLARVDWETIPVAIDDVERIEVTRAPSGATYGTNSFFAVVNIITRDPVTNQAPVVEAFVGNHGERDAYVKYTYSQSDTYYYITARMLNTDGFDNLNNTFAAIHVADGNDDLKQTQLHGRLETSLNDNTRLDTAISLVDKTKGTLQQDSTAVFGSDETGTDIYYRLLINQRLTGRHSLDYRFNYVVNENDNAFQACFTQFLLIPEMRDLYLINPALALEFAGGNTPTGSTAEEIAAINAVLTQILSMGSVAYDLTCGDINIDDKDTRIDISLHDTLILSDQLKMITGINLSSIEFESAYHLGGTIQNNRYSISNNTEYKPTDAFTVNIGVLAEMEEDYQNEKIYWSPRAAVNYHLNPNNTFRVSATRSYRTPDLYERESDWQINITGLSTPVLGSDSALHFFAVQGNSSLLPEQIESVEAGWYGVSQNNRWRWDTSVYKQTLTELISQGISPIFVLRGNAGEVILQGLDLDTAYRATSGSDYQLGYAYQDSDATDPAEETMYARHSGYIGIIHPFENELVMGIKAHTTSNLSGNRFTQVDVSFTKAFYQTQNSSINGQILVQYHAQDSVIVASGLTDLDFSNDSSYQFMAGISARF